MVKAIERSDGFRIAQRTRCPNAAYSRIAVVEIAQRVPAQNLYRSRPSDTRSNFLHKVYRSIAVPQAARKPSRRLVGSGLAPHRENNQVLGSLWPRACIHCERATAIRPLSKNTVSVCANALTSTTNDAASAFTNRGNPLLSTISQSFGEYDTTCIFHFCESSCFWRVSMDTKHPNCKESLFKIPA